MRKNYDRKYAIFDKNHSIYKFGTEIGYVVWTSRFIQITGINSINLLINTDMKPFKLVGLLVVILLLTTQCAAQRTYTVKAESNDISNNLDLKAVATVFGESKNLEEFEQRLNDYESNISNLDLNNDGQVDYLRVVEDRQNNTHVIVIQAVLDKEIYQDVATIVVDKEYNGSATVQVIGDPYIYGPNYIIEPAYYHNPLIYDYFWGMNYHRWYSPYYWGYYPSYYRHHSPFELNIYMSNIYGHINHDHRYYYSNSIRNEAYGNIRTTISRNDYATRYPDRSFTNRNTDVRNKRDFEFNRNGNVRNGYTRPATNTYENRGNQPRTNGNTTNQGQTRNNWNQRNSENNSTNQQNNGLKRDNNNMNQPRTTNPEVNRTNPPNINGRINQPRPRTETQTPTNTVRPENTNRNSTPATQPRINESRSSNPTEVKKEPRTETRDNTNRSNERK